MGWHAVCFFRDCGIGSFLDRVLLSIDYNDALTRGQFFSLSNQSPDGRNSNKTNIKSEA